MQEINQKKFAWIIVVLGGVGALASLILAYETYQVALNPDYATSCSLNPVFACKSVMDSPAGSLLLGVPNPFLGLLVFGSLSAIGVAILAGARLKQWFWKLFYTITLAGMALVVFFVAESLYIVGALCIYCMITWAAVIALFIYSTIFLVQEKTFSIPKKFGKLWSSIAKNPTGMVILIFVLIFGLILFRFRDYFEMAWF